LNRANGKDTQIYGVWVFKFMGLGNRKEKEVKIK